MTTDEDLKLTKREFFAAYALAMELAVGRNVKYAVPLAIEAADLMIAELAEAANVAKRDGHLIRTVENKAAFTQNGKVLGVQG